MAGARDPLFARVAELAERAPSPAELEHHRIELIAASNWRRMGRPVPAALVAKERLAAATALAGPMLLARVRAATEGPLLLIKGPEVARHFPSPTMRSLRDLDLIVPDAHAAQRQLLAAGFEEAGNPALYAGIHHLRPLRWQELPLVVEVHHSPKWIDRLEPPSADELLAAAVPADHGPPGLLVLPPAHHALVLAAHAWAHRPLSRLRDLIDVALVARTADPAELERLARAWQMRRVWATTERAIAALLGDGPRPASIAIWARHLAQAREQTVFESHLQDWLCALWGLPGGRALTATMGAVGADLVPEHDESWARKLARTRSALADAFVRKSEHDHVLASTKGGT